MRISNLTIKNNLLSQIKTNYEKSKVAQDQLSSGKKMDKPSQSPIEAINSIYHRIRNNKIEQYQKNTDHIRGALNVAYSNIDQNTQLTHRLRELTIQASNGTLNETDRKNMAVEVDQILRQMISTSNTKYKDSYLFSGADGSLSPFKVTYIKNNDVNLEFVDRVQLQTTNNKKTIDINEKNPLEINLSANKLFWSQNNTIIPQQNNNNYIANRDQTISINGKQIDILQGDNLDAVIQKINNNSPGALAEQVTLPNGTNTLSIKSASPEKLELLDLEGSTVLSDLGIILPGDQGQTPPFNISPNTIEIDGSVFSSIIELRNSLLENNINKLGSYHINALDNIANNFVTSESNISAMVYRLDENEKKLEVEKVDNIKQLSAAEDIDMVQASINYNQLLNIHRVSLMSSAKLNQTTLMDYLR